MEAKPFQPKIAWTPHDNRYGFLPERYVPKRTHIRYGDNYQLWTVDALFGVPILITEFKAHNDAEARRLVPEILASKLGSGDEREINKAKFFLSLRGKAIHLVNTDKQKEIRLRRRKLSLKDLDKVT